MSKHTPGPWVFDTENGDYPSWIEGAERAEVISGCGCCGSPNLGIDNARLICAAPDLLEALEAAVKTAQTESHPFRAWQALAESAIKKARGE